MQRSDAFRSTPPPLPSSGEADERQPRSPGDHAADSRLGTKQWLLPVGRSAWAIAAGYLGLFSILLFPAPLAIACGVAALVDLHRHRQRLGLGRAFFGIVMGVFGTVGLVLWLYAHWR